MEANQKQSINLHFLHPAIVLPDNIRIVDVIHRRGIIRTPSGKIMPLRKIRSRNTHSSTVAFHYITHSCCGRCLRQLPSKVVRKGVAGAHVTSRIKIASPTWSVVQRSIAMSLSCIFKKQDVSKTVSTKHFVYP